MPMPQSAAWNTVHFLYVYCWRHRMYANNTKGTDFSFHGSNVEINTNTALFPETVVRSLFYIVDSESLNTQRRHCCLSFAKLVVWRRNSVTWYIQYIYYPDCFNPLAPNDIYIYIYICRTAQLTSRRCILNIYWINTLTEYFKHAAHSQFFFLFKMAFIS